MSTIHYLVASQILVKHLDSHKGPLSSQGHCTALITGQTLSGFADLSFICLQDSGGAPVRAFGHAGGFVTKEPALIDVSKGS